MDVRSKRLRLASRILRWGVLAGLLAFVVTASFLHVLGLAAPSIHAICPYGGLESMLSFIAFGVFIKKIFLGTFILFIVTFLLAIIFRRSFCGQICPFGGLQEFFGMLGRKVMRNRLTMPAGLDKLLRYLKYPILIFTVIMAWVSAELWMAPYDPYNALGHLASPDELFGAYLVGFILLIVTIAGSFLFDRFFCKYLCPAGALYGIIGKISPFKVRVNSEKCIRCKLCDKSCPMNIKVMDSRNGTVVDIECINCNECVNACPKSGAISSGFGKNPLRRIIHPLIASLLVFALFFGPILAAKAFGSYQVLPNKFIGNGSGSGSGNGEGAGNNGDGVSSSDIKGYLTLGDTADILGMTVEELYEKLGLPDDFPRGYELKAVADYLNIEMDELKQRLLD